MMMMMITHTIIYFKYAIYNKHYLYLKEYNTFNFWYLKIGQFCWM